MHTLILTHIFQQIPNVLRDIKPRIARSRQDMFCGMVTFYCSPYACFLGDTMSSILVWIERKSFSHDPLMLKQKGMPHGF